ncbi:MAG: DUF1579 domain-containing protein [Planctomycetes bacterium]|nr:DUF1579 domain-containing protein [Planctomycetota bacterium]
MKFLATSLLSLVTGVGVGTLIQDKPAAGAQDKKPAAQEMDAVAVQAGPEHKKLEKMVGTWDGAITFYMGGQAMTSKAVETNTLVMNGLWLLSDFKGEFMGQPFHGHGIFGYDPVKKKHVSVWVDSMSSSFTTGEGEGSKDGKTMVDTMVGYDPSGKKSVMRNVTTIQDADHRTFEMYNIADDGKEALAMKIEYTRRK